MQENRLNQPDKNINLGLENINKLCQLLNNPNDKLNNIIHIAGTNGKGSTLFYIEQLLLAHNPTLKIARYISPHLQDITERFLINNQPISHIEFNKYNDLVNNTCDEYNISATYFERLTAIAFLYFSENNCDYCLLEAGLGGRLDATNIINNPLISIITNINYDHQDYLGDTLELITTEKAGILKPNSHYITGITESSLQAIVRKSAQQHNTQEIQYKQYNTSEIVSELTSHQYKNLELALNVFSFLYPEIDTTQLLSQILLVSTPGRYELINLNNTQVILDGFHNLHACQAVFSNLPDRPVNLLLGFTKGKNWKEIIDYILSKLNINYQNNIIFTTASTPELSVSPELIQEYLSLSPSSLQESPQRGTNINYECLDKANRGKGFQYINSLEQALEEYIKLINNNSYNLIGGSLYLVGNVKSRLEILNIE